MRLTHYARQKENTEQSNFINNQLWSNSLLEPPNINLPFILNLSHTSQSTKINKNLSFPRK